MQIALWDPELNRYQYVSRSVINRSDEGSNFLGNLNTVLHSEVIHSEILESMPQDKEQDKDAHSLYFFQYFTGFSWYKPWILDRKKIKSLFMENKNYL